MPRSNPPKRAVILAAGFGSRLRPLTDLRPKPLVAVHGVSILHNAPRNLEAVGVSDVAILNWAFLTSASAGRAMYSRLSFPV
ncbi:NTP transferase domain-containing protein [Sinorhizobium medicae]|nr:NTP transferase domain-containing protein [Sinorhizobium medicae]